MQDNSPDQAPDKTQDQPKAPSFMDAANSIFWAFLGVQSKNKHERDFTQGNPMHYIVMGIVGTLLFIVVVYFAVRLALSLAGV
jgi:hypothetical protein